MEKLVHTFAMDGVQLLKLELLQYVKAQNKEKHVKNAKN